VTSLIVLAHSDHKLDYTARAVPAVGRRPSEQPKLSVGSITPIIVILGESAMSKDGQNCCRALG
jgi:hypothetical protein